MEEYFKIRSYGYGELAQMYFPNIAKNSATVQFRRWIRVNTNLQNQLNISGFKIGQKLLTPKQVELIINSFGEP
jgi:hypothetical protein